MVDDRFAVLFDVRFRGRHDMSKLRLVKFHQLSALVALALILVEQLGTNLKHRDGFSSSHLCFLQSAYSRRVAISARPD